MHADEVSKMGNQDLGKLSQDISVHLMYTVEQTPQNNQVLAYGVVMKLLNLFVNKNYTIYVDNFYASPVTDEGFVIFENCL